jgi:hypothetical protein
MADAGDAYFEEVRTMRYSRRKAFYLYKDSDFYQPGIQLHVVPAFGCLNLEYLGEVVRVEKLPFGEFGVAVRLLHVEKMAANASSTTMAAFQALALADSSPVALPEGDSNISS